MSEVTKVSENLKIEIRPIPNRKGIMQFSDNLRFFSKFKTVPCLVNPRTHKYETGLSEADVNYLKEQGFPYDISDKWQKGVVHPFWESEVAKVDLKPTPAFLYPGKNLIDFVKYRFLCNSKFVYKSETDMKTGNKPEATHYIYNETEELEIQAAKISEINTLIREIGKLSVLKKKQFILILTDEVVDNRSEDYLTVRFNTIIEDKDLRSKLADLIARSKDKETTEEIAILADVKSFLQKGILKQTKQGIFFYDTNLGFSEEDVVKLLSAAENQEMYLNIKDKAL